MKEDLPDEERFGKLQRLDDIVGEIVKDDYFYPHFARTRLLPAKRPAPLIQDDPVAMSYFCALIDEAILLSEECVSLGFENAALLLNVENCLIPAGFIMVGDGRDVFTEIREARKKATTVWGKAPGGWAIATLPENSRLHGWLLKQFSVGDRIVELLSGIKAVVVGFKDGRVVFDCSEFGRRLRPAIIVMKEG